MRVRRLRAACGLLGPAAFTAAWAWSQRRQDGYSVLTEQISGLAAPDARAPWIMIGGFVALGVSALAFADGVEDALGGPRDAGVGPDLIRVAGLATLAAALFRRDRMLIDRRAVGQSLQNDVHDASAGIGYACLIAAPLALASRSRREPALRPLARTAVGSSVATLILVGALASGRGVRWHGIVQRAAVTIPLASMARLATRLLRLPSQATQ